MEKSRKMVTTKMEKSLDRLAERMAKKESLTEEKRAIEHELYNNHHDMVRILVEMNQTHILTINYLRLRGFLNSNK